MGHVNNSNFSQFNAMFFQIIPLFFSSRDIIDVNINDSAKLLCFLNIHSINIAKKSGSKDVGIFENISEKKNFFSNSRVPNLFFHEKCISSCFIPNFRYKKNGIPIGIKSVSKKNRKTSFLNTG